MVSKFMNSFYYDHGFDNDCQRLSRFPRRQCGHLRFWRVAVLPTFKESFDNSKPFKNHEN